jgi:hypothetical protein
MSVGGTTGPTPGYAGGGPGGGGGGTAGPTPGRAPYGGGAAIFFIMYFNLKKNMCFFLTSE